jgi:hypothetical protein
MYLISNGFLFNIIANIFQLSEGGRITAQFQKKYQNEVIGALIAAFFVKSLPIDTLRWVVVEVVLYTSFVMFRTAFKHRGKNE